MAVELVPERIRVNVVNPVAGDTPLLAQFMGADTPELRAKFIDCTRGIAQLNADALLERLMRLERTGSVRDLAAMRTADRAA